MKATYKKVAMSAVVFSALAIAATVGSAEASNGGPNDAYCINSAGTGSPWCGYATFSQCEEVLQVQVPIVLLTCLVTKTAALPSIRP
jgi:hypothetical protein